MERQSIIYSYMEPRQRRRRKMEAGRAFHFHARNWVYWRRRWDKSARDCRTGQNVGIKHLAEERQVGLVKGLGKKSARREREQEGWIKESPRWERK